MSSMQTKLASKPERVHRSWPKIKTTKVPTGMTIESLEERALCSASTMMTPSIPIPPPGHAPGIIAILIG